MAVGSQKNCLKKWGGSLLLIHVKSGFEGSNVAAYTPGAMVLLC